jgi:hypothetical protein
VTGLRLFSNGIFSHVHPAQANKVKRSREVRLKNLDTDWTLLQAAAIELQEYLLSAELYWPVTSKGTAGKLTLTPGLLLLSLKRLNSIELPGEKHAEFALLRSKIFEVQQRWRANWLKKVNKEYPVRLQLWKSYISDLTSDPVEHAPFYSTQVRLRAALHLLLLDMEQPIDGNLAALDGSLRQVSRPGPFVWEVGMAAGFSESDYWFLFRSFSGTPKTI